MDSWTIALGILYAIAICVGIIFAVAIVTLIVSAVVAAVRVSQEIKQGSKEMRHNRKRAEEVMRRFTDKENLF